MSDDNKGSRRLRLVVPERGTDQPSRERLRLVALSPAAAGARHAPDEDLRRLIKSLDGRGRKGRAAGRDDHPPAAA